MASYKTDYMHKILVSEGR